MDEKVSPCHNSTISVRGGKDTCDVCHKPVSSAGSSVGSNASNTDADKVADLADLKRPKLEKLALEEGLTQEAIDAAANKADLITLITEHRATKE